MSRTTTKNGLNPLKKDFELLITIMCKLNNSNTYGPYLTILWNLETDK
jgi:hypothetical protein